MAQQETPGNTMSFIDQLEPMVQIQKEATVSRTVMSFEGANVMLFTFDKGQELSEHTAAMPVFVQVLKGRLEVTGGDETAELVPGGLVHFTTRCRTRSAPSNRV